MTVCPYLYCRPIPQISQAKGLRDPRYGAFEPFSFIGAVGDVLHEAGEATRVNRLDNLSMLFLHEF